MVDLRCEKVSGGVDGDRGVLEATATSRNSGGGVGGDVVRWGGAGGDGEVVVVEFGGGSEVSCGLVLEAATRCHGGVPRARPHGRPREATRYHLLQIRIQRWPAARLVCALGRCVQQYGPEGVGGYVRRENQKTQG